MILENEQEKLAFDFVCKLASAYTDRICNDLNRDIIPQFKGMKVERDDNGVKTLEQVIYDFDIIFWLQTQVKKNEI